MKIYIIDRGNRWDAIQIDDDGQARCVSSTPVRGVVHANPADPRSAAYMAGVALALGFGGVQYANNTGWVATSD